MLTRALMLGSFPPLAAVRTTGRYLTRGGQLYNVVWDGATSRLLFYRVSAGALQNALTAVSSQAQTVAVTPNSRLGIYNVGPAGLVGNPTADYGYPAAQTGYSLNSMNASTEVLYTATATATATAALGGFLIRNLAIGVSSGPIAGQRLFSTPENTYNTGDGWITQIQQLTGVRTDTAPYGRPRLENGQIALQVNYPVDSHGVTPLARVGAPAIAAIPLTGLPRILAESNTIYSASLLLNGATTSFCRAGYVIIPARVTTAEVDVRSQAAGTAVVSVVEADWEGYLRADLKGAVFVPLSVRYGMRADVPCIATVQSDGSSLYRSTGQDFTITRAGTQNLSLYGVVPGAAGLWRPYGTSSTDTGILPAHIKTIAPDGAVIVDTDTIDRDVSLLALPHIGAFVRWSSSQFVDTAVIQISIDAGLTWRQARAFQSQLNNGAATVRGAAYGDLRGAIPLNLL